MVISQRRVERCRNSPDLEQMASARRERAPTMTCWRCAPPKALPLSARPR